MAVRQATITFDVDAKLAEAYHQAPAPGRKKVSLLVKRALRELVEPKAPRLSKKETELFLRINRTLPPEQQQRYDELKEKRRNETLTRAEHAELLQFISEIETIWADRLQAVIALAKLRRITPKELMKQLGIEPRSHDS
jgi:hypothetical protein